MNQILSAFNASGACLIAQNVKPGDVFIALRGERFHGIEFVNLAIANGCCAVLVEGQDWSGSVPSKRIIDLKTHLLAIAKYFYPQALEKKIIGITGTNGKTSVANFINQLLDKLGKSNTVIGTLNSERTTPDIFSLYKMLAHITDEVVILEVSSHALAQGRVLGLNFIQAIFTNLSQDHLDYHQNMDNYLAQKIKLFAFKSLNCVIVNSDDERHLDCLKATQCNTKISYKLGDFTKIVANEQGFLCQLDNFVFEFPLLGRFNLSNALAALSSVEQLGFSRVKIIPLLAKLRAPKGRMQRINSAPVWVDYAHSPDALSNAITTLKTHYPDFKIRLIFGCGGDRDRDKRAKMGQIAAKLASSVVLTNDNPRNEDPQVIINDILAGIDESFPKDITLDRQLAIETAITTLSENECLLIAGKGHENRQIFNTKTIQLNDIDIAHNALL